MNKNVYGDVLSDSFMGRSRRMDAGVEPTWTYLRRPLKGLLNREQKKYKKH